MTSPITQDRQIAGLTLPEGKDRIVRSVKSKAGTGLYVEVRNNGNTKSWLYRPISTGNKSKSRWVTTLQCLWRKPEMRMPKR